MGYGVRTNEDLLREKKADWTRQHGDRLVIICDGVLRGMFRNRIEVQDHMEDLNRDNILVWDLGLDQDLTEKMLRLFDGEGDETITRDEEHEIDEPEEVEEIEEIASGDSDSKAFFEITDDIPVPIGQGRKGELKARIMQTVKRLEYRQSFGFDDLGVTSVRKMLDEFMESNECGNKQFIAKKEGPGQKFVRIWRTR